MAGVSGQSRLASVRRGVAAVPEPSLHQRASRAQAVRNRHWRAKVWLPQVSRKATSYQAPGCNGSASLSVEGEGFEPP